MTVLGVTGTQAGATAHQLEALRDLIISNDITELHHGDCIGADAQAHELGLELGLSIVIHPPSNSSKRAFCEDAQLVLLPKPYLDRNHDIVDRSEILAALPQTSTEQLRSGTWATVRYARKRHLRVIVIQPQKQLDISTHS